MKHYMINFFNNGKLIRNNIKFEGDLITAKKFSMNIAKRLRIAHCDIYIYDRYGYERGDQCLAKLRYKRPINKKRRNK
tara:strand:+ start:470 stop:703 length:234 start_codon:yes stop_codon:yes gene_type:complete